MSNKNLFLLSYILIFICICVIPFSSPYLANLDLNEASRIIVNWFVFAIGVLGIIIGMISLGRIGYERNNKIIGYALGLLVWFWPFSILVLFLNRDKPKAKLYANRTSRKQLVDDDSNGHASVG